ncbi:MAG: TolC family protein [Vampirovibrio sp.]|nr:TolC family protein [Vampirovibrio sp.]
MVVSTASTISVFAQQLNQMSAQPSIQDSTVDPPTLTLEDFLAQVKANHPVLTLATLDREMASAKRLETQGAFDPSLNGEGSFNRFNSSSAVGKVQEAIDSRLTADILTRYGAKLSAGVKLARGDVKTPLSPTGETGEYFGEVTLPLLRGARFNPKAVKEKQALIGEPMAAFKYRRKELELLLKAIEHYWKWVGNSRKLTVEKQLIDLAEFRAGAVKDRADAGDLPQITAVEANREVKRRFGSFYATQRGFQESTFKLALFLWDTGGESAQQPAASQVPDTVYTPVAYTDDQLADGKLAALSGRPELNVLGFSKEITELDRRLAKNNMLPKLDAFLSQGVETGEDRISGAVIKAGVKVSVPLRWRTVKGQLQQAELSLQKLDVQQKQLIQQIFIDIEDSVSAINRAFDRYEAASEELDFAQQLAEGERTKFKYGDTTLFLVNQRERSAASANKKVIDAMVDYYQAVGRFNAVTGQL